VQRGSAFNQRTPRHDARALSRTLFGPASACQAPKPVNDRPNSSLATETAHHDLRLLLEEYTALDSAAIDLIAHMKLSLVGLDAFCGYLPSEISGGQQKRAAMALDPAILFLDEPSAGLDPITAAKLDRLTLRLARGLRMTFVIVSHELASIFAIAERVIMLDRSVKGIVGEGTPQEPRDASDNALVRRFFRREAQAV
jgi:phospholipid/cholesterol/gamma-HCH transport system ATP-binding protein